MKVQAEAFHAWRIDTETPFMRLGRWMDPRRQCATSGPETHSAFKLLY